MMGISQTMGNILMLVVTIALAALAYGFIAGFFDDLFQVVEVAWVTGNEITLRNLGRRTIHAKNIKFYVGMNEVPCVGIKDIEPGRIVRCYISGCIPYGRNTLRISGPFRSTSTLIEMPKTYCINATTRSLVEDSKSYLVIEGNVYTNDETKTLYDNRRIKYNLEQLDTGYISPPEIVSTDAQGNFQIKKEWNFTYLLPKLWWEVPYEYEWETEDLWRSPAEIPQTTQPGWPIRFGNYIIVTNPVLLKLGRGGDDVWRNVTINKDIKPVRITADNITFNISYEINVKTNIQPTNTEAWFGTLLHQSAFPPDNVVVECFDTPFASCEVVSGTVTIGGWPGENGTYSDSISINVNITNPNTKPLLLAVRIPSEVRRYQAGSFTHLYHGGAFNYSKLDPGETREYYGRISLADIRKWVRDRFGIEDITGEYAVRVYVRFPDWGETYAERWFRFYINENKSVNTLPGSWNSRRYSVLWRFNIHITPGVYNFSFLVTYPRKNDGGIWTVSAGNDLLAFVNISNKMITRRYDMWTVSSSLTNTREPSYRLNIPGRQAVLPNSSQAYTVAKVSSIEKLDGRYKLKINAVSYLLNFGNDNIVDGKIFKRRGVLFGRGWDWLNSTPTSCAGSMRNHTVVNILPQVGEIRSNWIFYRIGHSQNFKTPNITFQINGNDFKRHNYYTRENVWCTGEMCDYSFPGWLSWYDVTDFVGDAPIFNLTFVGNPGCGYGQVLTNPWLKFTREQALWQNRAKNKAILTTLDHEPGIYGGLYEYEFET